MQHLPANPIEKESTEAVFQEVSLYHFLIKLVFFLLLFFLLKTSIIKGYINKLTTACVAVL